MGSIHLSYGLREKKTPARTASRGEKIFVFRYLPGVRELNSTRYPPWSESLEQNEPLSTD
jgi:hypothetical protein